MNSFPICARAVIGFAFAMSLPGGERGYVKAVLIDGPLVFYRFNEGHLSASAMDTSTHARHGQYLGPGLSFLETVTGTDAAVRFSGGVVRIASSHALNPASITLEAVLLWRGPGTTLDCIFDKTTPSGDPLYRFCVQNDGVLQFAVRTHQNMSLLSKSKVPFNVPVHVTATCGSTGLKIYINGTLDASLNQIVGALGSGSPEAVSIGSGFTGIIDEAAIYSHVLSAARIASHAQAVGKLGPAEEVAPLTCFRVNSFALTPEVSVQLAGSYTVSGCRRSPASMSKVRARLTVDNVSYTVPDGGFHQQLNGWWIYSSPQANVAWALRIHPKNRQWQLTSNSASGITPPNVDVRLELDGEAGVDRIKATPANGHWSYAAGKQACQSQPSMQRISSTRLLVHAPSSPLSAEASFPVQFGVPFGRKELQSSRFARVRDAGGQLVASQTKVLGLWNGPDAAEGIRWLQVSFDALVSATHYTLEYGPCAAFGSPPPGIQVTSSATGVTVNTGPLQFVVNRSKPAVIHSARFDIDGDGQFSQDEVVVQDTGPNGLFTKDHNGSEYRSELDTNATLEVEEVGPHQVTLKATGEYISSGDGTPLNRWIVRMKAYAGKPYVRVYHTFVITEGGSARQFQDIGLEIQLAPDDDRTITFSGGTLPVVGADLPEPVHSSENHNFMAASHGALMLHQQSHKQYALYDSGTAIETKEQRSGHWFGAFGKTFGAAVAVRWFWQNYPGALEWTKTGLRVHFYKSVGPQNLDFQPEQYLRSRGASPGPIGQWDVFNQDISYVCKRRHEYPSHVCFNELALQSDCDSNEIIDKLAVCGQMHATGVGVAKTHELLLMFGPGNSVKRDG